MTELAIELLRLGRPADLAALLAFSLAAVCWLRATRALRTGIGVERALDGGLLLAWLAVVVFFLLASLGLFRVWIAAGFVLATGMIASALVRRHGEVRASPQDERLRTPDLRDPFLWSALPLAMIAMVRLIKSMVAPPMAWDAMTMHLPKAAFWIQSGSLALPDFPDAWTYYRWFPAGGEILFAWLMLPLRGDLLLGPFGFVVWVGIWVAGARLASDLGATNRIAWLAGAAVAALPAALVFMTANYVDNLVILFALIGVTHTLRFLERPHLHSGTLALAALGLAVATKTSSLLLTAPLVVSIAVVGFRARAPLGRAWLPALTGAASLPCVGYLWTWIATGSPFYPVKAPGLPLPHHEGLAGLFSGEAFAPAVLANPGWQGFLQLFRPAGAAGDGHMNFGLGGVILALAALIGLIMSLRKAKRRAIFLLCLAGATLTVLAVLSPDNLALRTVWIGVLGRHLLPAFASLALFSSLLPERAARITLSASLLAAPLHFLPVGWSASMTAPAWTTAALLAITVAALVAILRFGAERFGPMVRWGSAGVVLVFFLSSWGTVRAQARYPIYRETAAALGAYDAHPLHPTFATAASLWPMLDSPEPKRIALTVGPDKVGHNQFFYPLLGSRLQNRLVYLPTSKASNEVKLSARERYAQAEPEAWLAHLDAASVDLVIGLWQLTPERDWLARSGEFEVAALTDLGVPWIGRRTQAAIPESEQ